MVVAAPLGAGGTGIDPAWARTIPPTRTPRRPCHLDWPNSRAGDDFVNWFDRVCAVASIAVGLCGLGLVGYLLVMVFTGQNSGAALLSAVLIFLPAYGMSISLIKAWRVQRVQVRIFDQETLDATFK